MSGFLHEIVFADHGGTDDNPQVRLRIMVELTTTRKFVCGLSQKRRQSASGDHTPNSQLIYISECKYLTLIDSSCYTFCILAKGGQYYDKQEH